MLGIHKPAVVLTRHTQATLLTAKVLGRNISAIEQRPGCSFRTALEQNVFTPEMASIIKAFMVCIEVATPAHLGGNPSTEHVQWMIKGRRHTAQSR